MRLAINAVPLTEGGGLSGMLGYVRALRELGASIVAFASRPKTIASLRALEVEVVTGAVGGSLARRTCWQLMQMPSELASHRCDLLLSTNSHLPTCAIPQVVAHHNLWAFDLPSPVEFPEAGRLKLWVMQHVARIALHEASANFFVSDYLRRAAERIVPDSASHNHVIPNGLDQSLLCTPPSAVWRDEPLICAVQPNNPQKDNDTLIKAFHRMTQLTPDTPWRLVIAGGGDWRRYEQMAIKLAIRDRIQWLGHVDTSTLISLYDRSFCLMFTSYFESFGNPPLEAMARGCPVLAVAETAIPEVVGNAGILLRRGDSEAFAQAALSLWRDRGLRDQLVARGRIRAAGASWTRLSQQMLQVMRGVLN